MEFIIEWEVIKLNSINIYLIFIIDFMLIYFVRLVSIRVIIFSTSYIINEKFFSRFIILVFCFIYIFIIP